MTVPPPPSSSPHDPSWQSRPAQDPYGRDQPVPDPYAQDRAHDQRAHGSPAAAPQGTGAPGAAPGTDLSADIGAALRFAWQGLIRNAASLLGGGAIYFVLMIAVGCLGFFAVLLVTIGVVEALPSGGGDPAGVTVVALLGSVVLVLVIAVVAAQWQAAAANAAGIVADGGRPAFRQAMLASGRVSATAVLVLVLITLGSVLLYIPGLIAAVMFFYALPAALRGASPGAALRESVATARAHLGTTVVAFLLQMVVSYVGTLFVLGIIAAIPFTVLLQVGLHERLNRRPLPEPAVA